MSSFNEIDVPPSLQKLNVIRMGRENQKFYIQYEFQSNDDQPLPVLVYFDVKHEFGDTLEEFHKKASKRIQLRPELIQRTIAALSSDEYCRRVLQYYDVDREEDNNINNNNNNNSIATTATANDSNSNNNNSTVEDEQEEAYASSSSDPDYTDEQLRLLSVSATLRKNPMRLRVTGIIDTVRKPFKLLTAVYFTCRDRECRRRDA